MISAKLIKELESKGFYLEFPKYSSNEEIIIDILNQNNSRLNLAIPLLLKENFNYNNIIQNIPDNKEFDKIILITDKIYLKEGIYNNHIKGIIKSKNIKAKIKKEEIIKYHDAFKDAIKKKSKKEESLLKENIYLRSKLNINQALSKIFSPAKIRIMKKIFNHEKLTNTELKYYYKSIRPLIMATLNEDMRGYLKIIESTKKYK